MRNIILVAKREYLEQIRGRAFKLTTILVPALFVIIIGVGYVSSIGLGSRKHLVVASNDSALANAIRAQVLKDKDAKATVDVVAPASEADQAALIKRVQYKQVDGVLYVDRASLGATPTRNTLRSHPAISPPTRVFAVGSMTPSSMSNCSKAARRRPTPTPSSRASRSPRSRFIKTAPW